VVDKVKYSYRNDEETIRHLILLCPRWTDERRELRLPLRGVGFKKGCKDGTAVRWPKREIEAGYRGNKSYFSVFRKDRQVNLLARG
jgi:hypothetical protein